MDRCRSRRIDGDGITGMLPCPGSLRSLAATVLLMLAPVATLLAEEASVEADRWAVTVYAARMSSERGWLDLFFKTVDSDFIDVYLMDVALARRYAQFQQGALVLEAEGQVAKYFGDQDHWEFNAVPVVARWSRFPWNDRVATTTAFGLGLSYASELPPVEVEIENESQQLLVYWVMEATAGPPQAPWSISLRLHHRSGAWGFVAEEGGMNAVGLGFRYRFGG
jgi:hypothetical protein